MSRQSVAKRPNQPSLRLETLATRNSRNSTAAARHEAMAAARNAIKHGNPISSGGGAKVRKVGSSGKHHHQQQQQQQGDGQSKRESDAAKKPSWKERRHTFDPDKAPTQIRRRMSRKNSWEFMPKIAASRTPVRGGIQSFKMPPGGSTRGRFASGNVDRYSKIASANGGLLSEKLRREPHTRSEGHLSLTLASAGAGAVGGRSLPSSGASAAGFAFRAGSSGTGKGTGKGKGGAERSPSQAW